MDATHSIWVRVSLCASIAVTPVASFAESPQVHGFVTQAYTRTADNNFFGSSQGGGSFEFTELGINGSTRPTSDLQFAAQILARRAGGTDNGRLRLDYGLADYRFAGSEIVDFGFRAGRIKNPIGFYNDTRDVAFTRPTIILPQSLYFDRVRDLQISSDGLQLYSQGTVAAGDFNVQLQWGRARASDNNTEVALLGADRLGTLDPNISPLARISYDAMRGRLRFAYSEYRLQLDYSAPDTDPIGSGSVIFHPRIFSAQFNQETWSLTAEYARRRFEFDGFSKVAPYRGLTGESYYVQGTYQFAAKWELLARYDVLRQNKDDKDGEKFAALTQARGRPSPAYSQFAISETLTLSWSPSDKWLLRAEHHWIDGTAWLPIQDNPDAAAVTRKWRLFSLLASFRF